MTQADTSINFAQFDSDNDGVVDGLFFMIVNHTGDDGFAPLQPEFDFTTNDPASGGGNVRVETGRVVVVKPSGQERAVALGAHEWGHVLNLPELYGGEWSALNVLGWWDLGSFSIMGTGFPGLRAVPFDPYCRIRLGWDTAITVNTPLYGLQNGLQIPDYLTSGAIYKLPKSSTEYFLVTNHKGIDPQSDLRGIWEQQMPGNLGGLLIWHIDENALFSFSMDLNNKRIDCELAQGLFNYTSDYSSTTGANPVSGRDSLDFLKKYLLPNPCCTAWVGFTPPNIASARCYWNQNTKLNFDGLSNPNSDGYSGSIDPNTGMRIQNVPTHLAVRNIQKTQFGSATADLLVNNWYGRISQNTTWGPGVYAITGDITVDSGVTLTIRPGTTIKFQKNEDNQSTGGNANKSGLNVRGTLTCLGTQQDSIILTSSANSPSNGEWSGVLVAFPGRLNMEFTRISFADTAISVQEDTATVVVYNSTFTHFSKAAVSSRSAKTRLGGIVPIPVPPDCGRNNFLMGTATAGAKAVIKSTTPGGTVKAEGNWWSQAPPLSSWFSGSVDYYPYLLGPAAPDSCIPYGQFSQPPPEERVAVRPAVPVVFELGQNYPNPFNPATTIQYALPKAARVELKIFNMLGQVVRTLVYEERSAGYHQIIWDGRDELGRPVSTGIYLYQIKAGDFVKTMKMSFIK